MSLYDIFLQRAAQQHQNELNSDTGGIILASLAQGVMQGVQQEQAALKKQKEDDRVAEKQMERFNRIIKSQKDLPVGTKIKTSIDKEGNPSFSISQADDEEDAYKKESLQIRRDNLEQKIVEEKRRALTQKLNTAKTIGGIIPADEMQALNQDVGFDLGTDVNTGRIEQTPEGNFRILSNEEYSKKSDIIKTAKDAESKINVVLGDLEQMSKLYDKIPLVNTGPIQGRTVGKVAGFLGEENVRALEDISAGVLGNISRGLMQEVGVLTDQDVKRAKNLLPKLTDTVAVKKRNLDEIKNLISTRYSEFKRRTDAGLSNVGVAANIDSNFENLWK